MKVEKLTKDKKKKSSKKNKAQEEKIVEEKITKKSIIEKENKQLLWFFVVVIVVFASFLIPYFYMQNSKSFNYAYIDWKVEDYENLKIFHGRFVSIGNKNVNFNTYLRNDPRKNNVDTFGDFTKFKYNAVVSMSPEVDSCRGELARVMLDLGSYISQGIGLGEVKAGSTNNDTAFSSNREYANCELTKDKTVVIIELGEPKIIQNEENPYCYTIYAKDCQDINAVEKFIVHTTDSFGKLKEEFLANKNKED
jgi:uncharacterized integral membrane protein